MRTSTLLAAAALAVSFATTQAADAHAAYQTYLHTLDASQAATTAHGSQNQPSSYQLYLHTLDNGRAVGGNPVQPASPAPSMREHQPQTTSRVAPVR